MGVSDPAVIDWKWYYHILDLGPWAVVLALLAGLKFNHRAAAWLILLPALAVAIGWSMLVRLLSLSADTATGLGGLLVVIALSWAAVWLVAPWLARRTGGTALALAMVVMLATGAAYYAVVLDFRAPDIVVAAVVHLIGSLALVLAHVLAAICSRRQYRLGRFSAWLVLWLPLVPIVAVPIGLLITSPLWMGGAPEVLMFLVGMVISATIGGGLLGLAFYLVNLPFLLLVQRSPFWAARFQTALRLTPASDPYQVAADPAASEQWLDSVPESAFPEKEL